MLPRRRGEELCKKLCAVDTARPEADLEDKATVRQLFAVFHGTLEEAAQPPEQRVAPASVALKSR